MRTAAGVLRLQFGHTANPGFCGAARFSHSLIQFLL
jgi:hypothetical protein